MSTVTQRTHREADGPMGSHVEQDKTTTTSRDAANTQQTKRQTTSYQHNAPTAQQLIPNVSKQQLSLVLPVVLAVVLAIALLTYRGSLHWPAFLGGHQKTWKDHVSEGVQNMGQGLKEGLNSAYDTATNVGGQHAEYAKQKASEYTEYAKKEGGKQANAAYESASQKAADAAEYAKQKASEGASYAQDAAASTYQQAKDGAASTYQQAKDGAANAYDAAKDKVAPHPTLLGKASEYVHDKASQIYDTIKHTGHKTAEELKHEANVLAEQARHAAAQAGNSAEVKYDNVKASAQDTKRDVKSKMGY